MENPLDFPTLFVSNSFTLFGFGFGLWLIICRVWFCGGRFEDRLEMEGNSVPLSDGCVEVVVGDPQLLDKKISAIRTAGPAKLQVLFSFMPFFGVFFFFF